MSERELAALRLLARDQGTSVEWLLVDLATQTGLRVSELASLRPKDFDFDLSAVYVVRVKKREKPSPELLPLSPEVSEHVLQYISEFKCHPDLPIWVGQRGRWTKRGLQQSWKACCKKAGLSPRISIHAARHTMAVKLLRESKSLRMVQKQLGHSSPETTAKMYADVTFEDQQAALANLFRGV
jgi:integrase